MKTKIYHGNLNRKDVAQALGSFFNRGPLLTKLSSNGHKSFVHIVTRQHQMVGGKTSLNIALSQFGDRLEVRVGEQSLLGLAASLAKSAWSVVRNP